MASVNAILVPVSFLNGSFITGTEDMVIAKSALEGNALCVEAAVDYLLQLKSLGNGGYQVNTWFNCDCTNIFLNIRKPASHVGT